MEYLLRVGWCGQKQEVGVAKQQVHVAKQEVGVANQEVKG